MNYWGKWQATQGSIDYQRKCLAVKLAAEVSDLSEPMRLALKSGTAGILARLSAAIAAGITEGSLKVADEPPITARDTVSRLARREPHGEDQPHGRAVPGGDGTTRRILGCPED